MNKNIALAMVTLLTLVGFALRLYHLDTVPLRGDEAFSAVNWSGLPIAESLKNIATIEPHPPLTYIIFRVWGVFVGIDHEFTLRLLPALVNVLGIPALYALGRRLYGRTGGILAAAFWGLHPFQIWHSQDFRNYALWAGMSAITLWLAWRIITGQRRPLDWLFYAISAAVTGLTFYFELLSIGTVGLYVLLMHRQDRKFILSWLVSNSIVGGGVISIFLIFQGSLVGSGGYVGTGDTVDFLQLITRFLPSLIIGETFSVFGSDNAIVGFVLLLTLALCLGIIARWNTSKAYFLLFLGVIPPLLLAIVSAKLGIFNPRYVLLSVPAYILILCGGSLLLWQHPKIWGRYSAAALIIGWLTLSFISLNHYYHNPAFLKSHNWRALAAYLSKNVSPDDLVIQTGVDAAFGYYYDYYKIEPLDIALPSNFDQPASEITQILEEYSPNYDSLWVVGTTFTAWQNYGVVEAWVDSHMQRTRFTLTGGLPIRQYKSWEVKPDEITRETPTVYDKRIALVLSRVFLPPEPTDELTIWFYWRPLEKTTASLKVFVHLIGNLNPVTGTPLWSQADAFPQQGRVTTDTWQTNQIYRDVYTLNLRDVPAGTYQIVAGFYNPETGERLITEDNADSVIIHEMLLP